MSCYSHIVWLCHFLVIDRRIGCITLLLQLADWLQYYALSWCIICTTIELSFISFGYIITCTSWLHSPLTNIVQLIQLAQVEKVCWYLHHICISEWYKQMLRNLMAVYSYKLFPRKIWCNTNNLFTLQILEGVIHAFLSIHTFTYPCIVVILCPCCNSQPFYLP